MVEGGASLLQSFLDAGLWDEAYVEVARFSLGDRGAVPAPAMPCAPVGSMAYDGNKVYRYTSAVFRSLFPQS